MLHFRITHNKVIAGQLPVEFNLKETCSQKCFFFSITSIVQVRYISRRLFALDVFVAINVSLRRLTLREKCPYSVLFWSVFSHIRTKHEEILRISPYSVRIRENTDQNNSEYGQFLRRLTNLSKVCF